MLPLLHIFLIYKFKTIYFAKCPVLPKQLSVI